MTAIVVRPAIVADAKPIMTLVNELAVRQVMLPRSPASVIENIRDFLVAEVDGQFAGCGALAVTWTDLGEVRALAVDPAQQQHGVGRCLGAALVAIGDTEHPAEVARVMEYLASEEVLSEFSARTLFIPAHLGLSEKGVPFDTDLPPAKKSLAVFVGQVAKLSPIAIDLQAYPYNRIVFDATRDRLTQAIVGELTLDEAIARSQEDIDQALAEAGVQKS